MARVISSLDTRATHSRRRAKALSVLVRLPYDLATACPFPSLYSPFTPNSTHHGLKRATDCYLHFLTPFLLSFAFLPAIGFYNEEFGIKSFSIDGSAVKVTIWDTAGQDRFKVLTKGYYRGSQGALIGMFAFFPLRSALIDTLTPS